MKPVKTVVAVAIGLGMAGAAYAAEPFENAAQTELKRQTSEARLIDRAAAKICKGADEEQEIAKASQKASQNRAMANAKVNAMCGEDSLQRAIICPALYTDAPGGTGEAEYPLVEDVNLGEEIAAKLEATCLGPVT